MSTQKEAKPNFSVTRINSPDKEKKSNVKQDFTGSIDFDLHISEQTNLILQILKYAGVIIRDPQIVQDAAQQVAINEQNEKI